MKEEIGKILLYLTGVLLVIGLIGIVHALTFGFIAPVYDIRKSKEWLWKARASTDLNVMADYMDKALDEIKDRHGNPCWFFRTIETDFEIIKTILQQNIMAAREIALTEPKGSYGYQRAIDNIQEVIIEINEHLSICMDWLTIFSIPSIVQLILWIVITTTFCIIGLWSVG